MSSKLIEYAFEASLESLNRRLIGACMLSFWILTLPVLSRLVITTVLSLALNWLLVCIKSPSNWVLQSSEGKPPIDGIEYGRRTHHLFRGSLVGAQPCRHQIGAISALNRKHFGNQLGHSCRALLRWGILRDEAPFAVFPFIWHDIIFLVCMSNKYKWRK